MLANTKKRHEDEAEQIRSTGSSYDTAAESGRKKCDNFQYKINLTRLQAKEKEDA